jgi:flagellar protein FlbD
MIELHRLARPPEPFLLNPDLIQVVESTPDTHVTLTTGMRYVVTETPAEVTAAVRAWRSGVLTDALGSSPGRVVSALR